MTLQQEFLEILCILAEGPPQPAGKKLPSTEKEHTSPAESDKSDKQNSEKQRQRTGA